MLNIIISFICYLDWFFRNTRQYICRALCGIRYEPVMLPVLYKQQIKRRNRGLWQLLVGGVRVISPPEAMTMKFFSIFCHTITTLAQSTPHALAGPTVNFSSLRKKEEWEKKRKMPLGREREVWFLSSSPLEDRHFYRGDSVQRRSIVGTGWKRGWQRVERDNFPSLSPSTLLLLYSSFLKPLCPIASFFFLSLFILALCVSVWKHLCLYFNLSFWTRCSFVLFIFLSQVTLKLIWPTVIWVYRLWDDAFLHTVLFFWNFSN